MTDGISAQPLPEGFPYKGIIDALCARYHFFPCLVGAIKMNETGLGKGAETEQNVSFDGGHGIMQLTSSFPSDWLGAESNIEYAIVHYLVPAYMAWRRGLEGGDLVRAIAATYNAGMGNALAGHDRGDVDEYTTDHYGQRALTHYQALVAGKIE